jgi:hypothetical protein
MNDRRLGASELNRRNHTAPGDLVADPSVVS